MAFYLKFHRLESLKKSLPDNAKWFQIDDYDQYKLEEIVEMSYNSFVAYPTCFLHNPYIKEDWFQAMPETMFKILEEKLGWHLCITCNK